MSAINFKKYLAVSISLLSIISADAFARTPSLVVSNEPLPASLSNQIYAQPGASPIITPNQVLGSYFEPSNTMVSRKISELNQDLQTLNTKVSSLSNKLSGLQRANQTMAAEYYANVATINTQLQSGTTPGNPRLLQRLSAAQGNLDQLEGNTARLNEMAVEAANAASVASFMLEGTRSAYGLTGAVEEDHVQLAQMEDNINNAVIVIDRLQNNISDDVTRTSSYLTTERNNLRTLGLAVSNGDLYGKSLANRPFSAVARERSLPTGQPAGLAPAAYAPAPMPPMAEPSSASMQAASMPAAPSASNPRPLAKIRFDRANVNYEQSLYMAMNEAMAKYPNARYEIVAVHPSVGNAAQVAIESTKARRNAEKVLRTMTQMGVPMEQVDISTAPSSEAVSSEVQIYIR